jgi:hypothetical protein
MNTVLGGIMFATCTLMVVVVMHFVVGLVIGAMFTL